MYATIASYLDPIEAHIVCGRLLAEGIDAHVADAHTNIGNWEWRHAIGGTKVRVPSVQFEEARSVIASLDKGEFVLSALAEPGPDIDRESWSSRIAYIFGLWFGIPVPWRRRSAADE